MSRSSSEDILRDAQEIMDSASGVEELIRRAERPDPPPARHEVSPQKFVGKWIPRQRFQELYDLFMADLAHKRSLKLCRYRQRSILQETLATGADVDEIAAALVIRPCDVRMALEEKIDLDPEHFHALYELCVRLVDRDGNQPEEAGPG